MLYLKLDVCTVFIVLLMFATPKYKNSCADFCQNPWNLKYVYSDCSIQHMPERAVLIAIFPSLPASVIKIFF